MKKSTKNMLTRFLSTFMIALLILANPGMLGNPNGQASAEIDYDSLPPLLITELMPDSKNHDGSDAYEYIEVYNNTDQTINFKDYQVILRYPEGPEKDQYWTPENRDVDIEAGGTLVLWVKPSKASINDLTIDHFNEIYGTKLVEGVDIVDMPNSGAMHNQRLRDILIRTNTGEEIVRAEYNNAEWDVVEHKGVIYKYPEDGSNKMEKVSAGEHDGTPGTLASELVGQDLAPETPVSVDPATTPTVSDLTESSQSLDNVNVSVEAKDEFLLSTLTAHYRKKGEEGFHTLNLEYGSEGVYSDSIPFQDIIGAEEIEYYFEATNGLNSATSEVATIDIKETDADVPPLLITELVPQTKNLNAANAYEYVEVYNNTNQAIDFGYFYISYRLPNGNTSDWFKDLEDAVIQPGDNLVLWVDNGKNDEATDEMFKENFGLAADADMNLVKGKAGAGMANGGERDLVIMTKTGEEVTTAGYNKPGNKNNDEVGVNTGIFYHYPIGSNEMVKLRTGLAATPGTVEEDLVPEEVNKVDESAQTDIVDQTNVDSIKPGDSIEVIAEAEDNFLVTKMTLFYKQENEGDFESVELNRDSERLFRHTIKTSNDAKLSNVEYYLEAENGFTTTKTETQTVEVEVTSVPDKPNKPSPENKATDIGTETNLSVHVSDELGGNLDVKFYQGKSFNTSKTNQVRIFENATDTEPPNVLAPEGERELSEEEYEKLGALNGERVSLDSEEQFPYQRFEITLDEVSLQQDEVEAIWHGASLEGRKVSLYAWNLKTNVWDLVDAHVADSEDTFSLMGNVSVADYVDDQTLNVLVQDEIDMENLAPKYEVGDEPDFADFDFNFVWLADTQFYTEVFPWHYENQVNWIADNKDNFNLEYVFHSGDIVNTWNRRYQWDYADEYMKVLEDADVPYGILAGNHDVGLPEMDYRYYYDYFGEDRFKDQPYYGESFQNNRGHYDLISVEGIDFIMVHMGWQPQDDGIAWMNKVLEEHPNRIAILNFHQYVDETKRTEVGDRIFEEVVVPNENVQMVINGHHFGANFMKSEVEDNDGSTRVVHELMGNFQDETEGGLGFLNMMSFDVDTNSMYITSFSPSYETEDYADREDDKYNFYDDTPYRVELDLSPMIKNVATDYFEVNTYAGEEIGSVTVESGETAEVTWSDLEKGAPYSWYAVATNEYDETTMSDMFHFTTEGLPATGINEAPIIYADDQEIDKGKDFDPLTGVVAIDAKDGNITGNVKVVESNVETNKVGSYNVTYQVTNSIGITVKKTITVTVVADEEEPLIEAPVINADDVSITEGDEFEPLDGVTATDANDKDITSDIKVIENNVDAKKTGEYEVVFEVTDSNDLTTTKTITVTVQEKEQPAGKDPENDEEEQDEEKTPVGDNGNDTTGTGDGDKLPTTATNMYTWLVLGMLFIAAAGIFLIYHNRRKA